MMKLHTKMALKQKELLKEVVESYINNGNNANDIASKLDNCRNLINDIVTLVNSAEKDLYQSIQNITFSGSYTEYLKQLTEINPVVTKFFDEVLVMDKDENIKNNRLALLNTLKKKYIILVDFSQL